MPILKIKSDKDKYDELSKKIFKAQIVLDRFKKAVKTGQKNIKLMRDEKKRLRSLLTGEKE